MANELVCPDDVHILFQPYGQSWRALRKGVVGMLNITNIPELLPLQEAESTQTMYDIMHSPGKWYRHVRRYGTAVVLAAAFGQRGATYDDPKIKAFYEIEEEFGHMLAVGATPPVDAFPFLKYIPGFLTPYKSKAVALGQKQRAFYASMLSRTKERMQKPGTPWCFMQKLLEKEEKSGLTYDQLVYVGGTLVCFAILKLSRRLS